MKTMTKEEPKFGFGLDETTCEPYVFDTVDELLEYAQYSWDEKDGCPFDEDCDYSGYIWVGKAVKLVVSKYAPTIEEIADSITDAFYCLHNIDECVGVQIYNRSEAEMMWREFLEKYFELPAGTTILTEWFGIYDLNNHDWCRMYSDFAKFVKNN